MFHACMHKNDKSKMVFKMEFSMSYCRTIFWQVFLQRL